MEGVSVVRLVDDSVRGFVKEFITNLMALRKKIIRLFGPAACVIYGLIQKIQRAS
jgi:hypothetical protein